jgi:hypothetical protein
MTREEKQKTGKLWLEGGKGDIPRLFGTPFALSYFNLRQRFR